MQKKPTTGVQPVNSQTRNSNSSNSRPVVVAVVRHRRVLHTKTFQKYIYFLSDFLKTMNFIKLLSVTNYARIHGDLHSSNHEPWQTTLFLWIILWIISRIFILMLQLPKIRTRHLYILFHYQIRILQNARMQNGATISLGNRLYLVLSTLTFL